MKPRFHKYDTLGTRGVAFSNTILQLQEDGWRELDADATHFRFVKGRRLKKIDRETGVISDHELEVT